MVKNFIAVVVILVITWLLTRVVHLIFKKIMSLKEGLELRFFERLINALVIIFGIVLAISACIGIEAIWKTLLGGTAILSAVLGFAGQDIIKDILSGLMITIYKPFEIGNRIEVENGISGVVIDITMRHVVLRGMDTQCYIIPNSKLNVMKIRNFSYQMNLRSAEFKFHIAHDSDVEKAIEVIRTAIQESDYSVPGKHTKEGDSYASVYFMEYGESCLELRTTVYYTAETRSEIIANDVNIRVLKALRENGIEIPYPYINVVQK